MRASSAWWSPARSAEPAPTYPRTSLARITPLCEQRLEHAARRERRAGAREEVFRERGSPRISDEFANRARCPQHFERVLEASVRNVLIAEQRLKSCRIVVGKMCHYFTRDA